MPGATRAVFNMDLMDRFEDKYIPIPETGCWIWLGFLKDNGYGNFHLEGKQVAAHRASYLIHKGEIESGNVIRHTCDIRCCVNPAHLLSGTQKENMRDMVTRNRQSIPNRSGRNNSMYGRKHSTETKKKQSQAKQKYKLENHTRATIDNKTAAFVKLLKGKKTAKKVSEETGVSFHVVRNIWYGKSWRSC